MDLAGAEATDAFRLTRRKIGNRVFCSVRSKLVIALTSARETGIDLHKGAGL
jgi:hypothetical protein